MKNAIIVLSLIALVSCENRSFQKLGEINYLKSSTNCNDRSTEYWLMDMKCTDKKDSVLFDSKTIGRKFELNISNVDTGSHLFHLLADLCVGDSIYLEMPATDFYKSMRGVTPKGDKTLGQNERQA